MTSSLIAQNSINKELAPYLELYMERLGNENFNVESIQDDTKTISLRFAPTLDNAAYALGMDLDDVISVVVNREEWDTYNELEKLELMFHELSHDILNAEHVDDVNHLMYHDWDERELTVELLKTKISAFFNAWDIYED